MIEYKTGDIFAEQAEALVNTVNCVGVMGRGVALQFKRAFPENFKAYADKCKRNEMQPGHVFVFETGEIIPPRYIINFPTKRHWRGKSRIEDIESGLVSLAKEIRSHGIRFNGHPSPRQRAGPIELAGGACPFGGGSGGVPRTSRSSYSSQMDRWTSASTVRAMSRR